MRKLLTISFILAVLGSCKSQRVQNQQLMRDLEKNINTIEFSKLAFFPAELIQLGTDTSFQSNFKKALHSLNSVKRYSLADKREYELTLFWLCQKITEEKTYERRHQPGKDFLLKVLSKNEKLSFSMYDSLILKQLDDKKRGMIQGYDEGVTTESAFIFFSFDPKIYKGALLKSSYIDKWNRLPAFLCNYLRENENPLSLRHALKERILKILNENDFREAAAEFKSCDVSVNLFD